MAFTAKDVQELRERAGAGMMDCKKALNATNGDVEKAVMWLREQGITKAAKREGRVAASGSVASYIHMGGKIGVLVEVNCETDFVARGEEFQAFCKDVCLQICSANPRWITKDEVDANALAQEKALYVKEAAETGKPPQVCEKIADGKLQKWYSEVCLLDQPFVKDPDKKINDLMVALSGKCGEKISIRRFARYALGEGIEKKESNLAEEVAAELAKAAAREGK